MKNTLVTLLLVLSTFQVFAADTLEVTSRSQYLTIADSDSLDLTDDFTLVIWMKPDAGTTSQDSGIIAKQGSYVLWQYQGAVKIDLNNGTQLTGPSVTAGAWNFVVCRRIGSALYLNINNSASPSTATYSNTLTTNTTELLIANYGPKNRALLGDLSYAAIFDSGLSDSELTEIYNSGVPKQLHQLSDTIKTDMVLALPLNSDVADGREFEDFSGKENNASLSGSPTITGTSLSFDPGNTIYDSFSFDGTDDYISVSHAASLNSSNFSVSGWFKAGNTTDQSIIEKSNPNTDQRQWEIGIVSGALKFAVYDVPGASAVQDSVSSAALESGRWYHFTAVHDDTNDELKLFLDNVEVSKAYTAGVAGGTADLHISSRINSSGSRVEYFDGSMTQLTVFNSALSDAQIEEIYNKNVPLAYDEISSTITASSVLSLELTSNDSTLDDLSTNSNDGTANGGLSANGAKIDWEPVYVDPQDLVNTTSGHNAGVNNTGTGNTFLGSNAGVNNISGENNVFIGSFAGAEETGSNKLYISNSDTPTPLIYGEFDNQLLQVNGELRVTGGILANKIEVQVASAWPDYVFAKGYKLPSLDEVEAHIKEHKHLPGIPSAKEIKDNGTLKVDKIIFKQMEKIEELTLYILELKKQNEALNSRLNALEKANK